MATTTLKPGLPARPAPPLTKPWRRRRVWRWRTAVRLAVLLGFTLIWGAPVLWMVLTSLKPETQTMTNPPHWLPAKLTDFTLANYRDVIEVPRGINLVTAFKNSLVVATLGAILTVLIDVPAAYALARMRFPGRNLLFAIAVASLIVPGEILLVPNYVRVWKLGWLNDYKALIIPPLASAFGVFLLRQFMLGIPKELEDAAKLDGAGHLRILWDIIVPSTRGAIAALAIFTFVFFWNEFTWPYITITQADKMTLPVALIQFRADFQIVYGKQMAGNVLSALPAIVVFLLAQRMIIRSITLTGIKG
jgi:multiple sugar transport system permease protein